MQSQDRIEIVAELRDLMSGQFANMNAQVAQLDNSIANLGRRGGSSGGGLVGSIVNANILTSALMRAKQEVVNFATSGFESLQKFESYEARLTTLLADRREAMVDIELIKKDAARTPFDVGSLVEANAALIGAGESARGARKMVLDVGNAIAATGGGADELKRISVNLNQIRSLGKASALDIKQFVYAGIPIYKMLSQTLHKTADEVKGMDITYKDLAKSFNEAGKEGQMFYQGLENMSATLSGKVSNLGDNWEQLKVTILGSQKGILSGTVQWASDMVTNLNRAFTNQNQVDQSFKKYGAKQYSWWEAHAESEGGKFFGDSKSTADEKYQDALNKNYVDKASKSPLDAANSMRDLAQLIANNSTAKAIMEQGKDENGQNIAILKGTLDRVKDIYYGLKKPGNKSEAEGGAKEPSSLEKVAKANRPTQININIENLVRELTNVVNSTKEAKDVSAQQVARIFLGVVNDASVLKQDT